jgi:hypothetical protein
MIATADVEAREVRHATLLARARGEVGFWRGNSREYRSTSASTEVCSPLSFLSLFTSRLTACSWVYSLFVVNTNFRPDTPHKTSEIKCTNVVGQIAG